MFGKHILDGFRKAVNEHCSHHSSCPVTIRPRQHTEYYRLFRVLFKDPLLV